MEELRFTTADGLELNGWLLQPEGGREWGAVLVFNGNAGHRAYRAPLAEALARAGLAVLLFDYRGYGENLRFAFGGAGCAKMPTLPSSSSLRAATR